MLSIKTTNLYNKDIEKAEKLREQGHVDQASEILSEIVRITSFAEDWLTASKALAQLIVCYKHIYQNTDNPEALTKMKDLAIQGMYYKSLPEVRRAVFYLRFADALMLENDIQSAVDYYTMAHSFTQKHTCTQAEYLGHLAEAVDISGNSMQAMTMINESLGIMKHCSDVRPFHKIVINSGLQARKVKIALHNQLVFTAAYAFLNGYTAAWWLRIRYGMGQRLKQYHNAMIGK